MVTSFIGQSRIDTRRVRAGISMEQLHRRILKRVKKKGEVEVKGETVEMVEE